jgi:hypothetical protein
MCGCREWADIGILGYWILGYLDMRFPFEYRTKEQGTRNSGVVSVISSFAYLFKGLFCFSF